MAVSPHRSYCAGFRQERSYMGIKLSVLKSGLQKAIRRGDVDLALSCGLELWSFKDAPGKPLDRKRIRTNILHRLMIIFLEDVGQAKYWVEADAMYHAVCEGSWPDKQAMCDWIAFLVRCPKSRACSHARAVARDCESDLAKTKYPSIYAQSHGCPPEPTMKQLSTILADEESGRAEPGKAVIYAYRLSESPGIVKTPYGRKPVWAVYFAMEWYASQRNVRPNQSKKVRAAHRAQSKLLTLGLKWGKILKGTREAFLCWMLPLLTIVSTPRFAFDGGDSLRLPVTEDVIAELEHKSIEMPDYVMDMHVTGVRDTQRFALEGSVVTNEDTELVNPEWKQFYVDGKVAETTGKPAKRDRVPSSSGGGSSSATVEKKNRVEQCEAKDFPNVATALGIAVANVEPGPGVRKETDAYAFLLRIQLTTSRSKTDVYFATDPKGRVMVIKGPMRRTADAEQAVALSVWKRDNGLCTTDARTEWLLPDRWPLGVPLGIRNSVNRAKPAPFLVATSLFAIDAARLPAKTHESKLWPPTQVVDWTQLSNWAPMKFAPTAQEQMDYVTNLLYRYVFGLGDLADRNFVRANHRVVSIDEDGVPKHVNFYVELRKNKALKAAAWTRAHWSVLEPRIAAWTLTGPYDARRKQVLERGASLFDP